VDAMKFVADVTYGDNDMKTPPLLKPGQEFVKVWRLENSGTCPWTPQYHLVYAYGNVSSSQMKGLPVAMPGNISPGKTADVAVALVAPQAPYTYQGFWHMENDKGVRFGQAVWAGITTQTNISSTPQPTGNYCEVNLTTPIRVLKPREDFDAAWTVKNVSGFDWSAGSVDYKYVSGTETYKHATYDLSPDMLNGESRKIIVDMLAPARPGTYTTQWAILSKTSYLCNLVVTITVR
jgi:hypothetical protein